MTESALIVGGLHDGQTHIIAAPVQVLTLAIQQQAEAFDPNVQIQPIDYQLQKYHRVEVWNAGRLRIIYRHPSIDPRDIVAWVEKGYV